MDRAPKKKGKAQKGKPGYRRGPSPPIGERCWLDADLEFFLTGDYDMTDESIEVQIMLDLASYLTDARVEWSLTWANDRQGQPGAFPMERPPRHMQESEPRRRTKSLSGD